MNNNVVSRLTVVRANIVVSALHSPAQYQMLYVESCRPTRMFVSEPHMHSETCAPVENKKKSTD